MPQDQGNDVSKSSYNIFAVRRAFAYAHSVLCAQEARQPARAAANRTLGEISMCVWVNTKMCGGEHKNVWG